MAGQSGKSATFTVRGSDDPGLGRTTWDTHRGTSKPVNRRESVGGFDSRPPPLPAVLAFRGDHPQGSKIAKTRLAGPIHLRETEIFRSIFPKIPFEELT